MNIAEILKDCPKGMELDCTCADNVVFDKNIEYDQIKCVIGECRDPLILDKYGRLLHICCPKCVIFPKGKTTWEGFQRPFKDGDIVTWEDRGTLVACIYKERKNTTSFNHHIALYEGGLGIVVNGEIVLMDDELCFATKEEKQKLFDAIKANGYKWNAETKTLEKLIEPKFKVGDRVLWNYNTEIPGTISRVKLASKRGYVYWIDCEGCSSGWWDETELTPTPNKFDITTLKPFDKVLVRDSKDEYWNIGFFSFQGDKHFCTARGYYAQCIPFENNKHLLGTANDCDDYFKTWE